MKISYIYSASIVFAAAPPVIFHVSEVQVDPRLPVAFHALNALRFTAQPMAGYVTGARHLRMLFFLKLQDGAPQLAQLVQITPITRSYGRYIYSYWDYKPTYNWGAPSCRVLSILLTLLNDVLPKSLAVEPIGGPTIRTDK